jgi:hypothetical protein
MIGSHTNPELNSVRRLARGPAARPFAPGCARVSIAGNFLSLGTRSSTPVVATTLLHLPENPGVSGFATEPSELEREQNYAHDPIVPELCMGTTRSASPEIRLDPRFRFRVEARAGASRAEVENSVAHAAPALPESKRPDLSAPHCLLACAFAQTRASGCRGSHDRFHSPSAAPAHERFGDIGIARRPVRRPQHAGWFAYSEAPAVAVDDAVHGLPYVATAY